MTSRQASSAYPAGAPHQTKASDIMCNSATDGSTTRGHIPSREPAGNTMAATSILWLSGKLEGK